MKAPPIVKDARERIADVRDNGDSDESRRKLRAHVAICAAAMCVCLIIHIVAAEWDWLVIVVSGNQTFVQEAFDWVYRLV